MTALTAGTMNLAIVPLATAAAESGSALLTVLAMGGETAIRAAAYEATLQEFRETSNFYQMMTPTQRAIFDAVAKIAEVFIASPRTSMGIYWAKERSP